MAKTKKPKKKTKKIVKKEKGKIRKSGSYKRKPKVEFPTIPPEPKSQKRNTPLIIAIVIIFILLGIIFYEDFIPDKTPKIMKCIASKAQLFATTTCPFCTQQIGLFGDYSVLFNITYCNQNPNVCNERGIQSVPFWVINTNGSEQGILGLIPVEELKELTGC